MKFSEYYLALTSGAKTICAPSEGDDDEGFGELEGNEMGDNNEADADGNLSKPTDHNYNNEKVELDNVKGISDKKNYSVIEIKGKNLPHLFAEKTYLKSIA